MFFLIKICCLHYPHLAGTTVDSAGRADNTSLLRSKELSLLCRDLVGLDHNILNYTLIVCRKMTRKLRIELWLLLLHF